jgi:putative transposase
MLTACIDGLKGFHEAVEAIFPKTKVQLCIVHQIRSSIRYIPEKDKKAVMADIKPIYQANNEQQGYERLLEFEEKLGNKYPLSCKSWLDNWVNLSAFFEYDQGIRKIIYTINPIEGVQRQIRKITKTKGAFSSEQA